MGESGAAAPDLPLSFSICWSRFGRGLEHDRSTVLQFSVRPWPSRGYRRLLALIARVSSTVECCAGLRPAELTRSLRTGPCRAALGSRGGHQLFRSVLPRGGTAAASATFEDLAPISSATADTWELCRAETWPERRGSLGEGCIEGCALQR